MITAFVMMNAERERLSAIPDEILKIPGVTEVYSVAGDYDIIAIVRVKEAEDLAKTVTENFARIKGITKTKTQIAFACFSNYDLEHMFSVGMTNSRK
jgi:DNA-binding Lrp family transcriptional regulator